MTDATNATDIAPSIASALAELFAADVRYDAARRALEHHQKFESSDDLLGVAMTMMDQAVAARDDAIATCMRLLA